MDRITEIRIQNLRSLEDVRLPLGPLTVLIGDNGTGKSSLVEALMLLRRAAEPGFLKAVNGVHGGGPNLLRWGASGFVLNAKVEGGEGPPLRYTLELSGSSALGLSVESELVVTADAPMRHFLERSGVKAVFPDASGTVDGAVIVGGATALEYLGDRPPNPAIARVFKALSAIEVHPGWRLGAGWAATATQAEVPMRGSALMQRVDGELGLTGDQLVLVIQELRNELGPRRWSEMLDLLRLGLGRDLEDLVVRAGAGGGHVALWLRFSGQERITPASALSDGQLAWLAFVALERGGGTGGLLVFDEPEKHLNPRLLARVSDLLQTISETRPVVLATHSDRLLDTLQEPAKSVVTCELGPERSTLLRRPDPEALEEWMQDYSGYGSIRAAGLERLVLGEEAG